MSLSNYPVHVDASLDGGLSRWLWLVKWLLVIPHYFLLAFLWVAFAVVSVAAFFAILFTGSYPRPLFDFNVGVLRWSWRVGYYAYGALGTDRYPPFTLDEVPDYPAHLEIEYPEHLSRGLVLVKWWLLAIPHYLIVGIFAGGGVYAVTQDADNNWVYGGGLIALMVLIAAVVLAFTGRYPKPVFDFVLGMNRWVLRVAAYAGLMTDEYPPFRLDMGGEDPRPPHVVEVAPVAPASTAASRPWSPGRLATLVTGALLVIIAGGVLTGGVTLAVAQATVRDADGFYMTPTQDLATGSYALASEAMALPGEGPESFVPESVLGDARVKVVSPSGTPLFVGVGDSDAVAGYLSGVSHATLTGFDQGDPVYRDTAGSAPTAAPGEQDIWVASGSGSNVEVTWPLESGDWTIVVMNADGSADVSADVRAGATFPAIGAVVVTLLVVGALLLAVAIVLFVAALHTRRPAPTTRSEA